MAARVAAVIEENEALHGRLEELGDIDEQDWQDMREHVALLMEENKLLLSQKQEQAVRADRLEAAQTSGQRFVWWRRGCVHKLRCSSTVFIPLRPPPPVDWNAPRSTWHACARRSAGRTTSCWRCARPQATLSAASFRQRTRLHP